MKNELVLLDLFSGIGGFHKGLSDAGIKFKKVYFSEIDKHAVANYKYNFPNAEHIGSVTDILSSRIERPNIITFGSPCQDFSLAGKRKGLEGDRSSLIEHALSAVSHFRPDIFIWENVKGTFSSNGGKDFIAILQAIADIGLYDCEWQLVNTSWVLPQNRERIYLIGHLATSFRDWKWIFPIRENDENVRKKDRTKLLCTTISKTIKATYGKLQPDATYILPKGHGYVEDSITEYCPTIRRNSFEHNTSVLSYTRDSKGKVENYHEKDVCNTLHSSSGSGGNTDQFIISNYNIRKLTEIECERLQGFPDNWTKWGMYDNELKQIAKTQRYKMCGNAVTAKIVELIGKRTNQNLWNAGLRY